MNPKYRAFSLVNYIAYMYVTEQRYANNDIYIHVYYINQYSMFEPPLATSGQLTYSASLLRCARGCMISVHLFFCSGYHSLLIIIIMLITEPESISSDIIWPVALFLGLGFAWNRFLGASGANQLCTQLLVMITYSLLQVFTLIKPITREKMTPTPTPTPTFKVLLARIKQFIPPMLGEMHKGLPRTIHSTYFSQ